MVSGRADSVLTLGYFPHIGRDLKTYVGEYFKFP
jgi:hypothetical protein